MSLGSQGNGNSKPIWVGAGSGRKHLRVGAAPAAGRCATNSDNLSSKLGSAPVLAVGMRLVHDQIAELKMGRAVTRNKWAAIAIVVLAAFAAGWYFYSPVYTLQQMSAAAKSNDSDAVSAYIDFPALREDMKAELMAQLIADAEKDTSGYSGLGLAMGSAMIGPMIDGMISPAGLRGAFISNERRSKDVKQEPQMGVFELQEQPVIERRSFSEFKVKSKDAEQGAMMFKRHGLSWKLSGVDLPSVAPQRERPPNPIHPYTQCIQDAETDAQLEECKSLQ